MDNQKSTQDIPVICDLDLTRYLGKWYEIARLPHKFEDGLENVTATYRLQDDGKIEVLNEGIKDGESKKAKGVAWVPDSNCTGRLFVRFFWPFKSEYKVIQLDEKDYTYAVVTSRTKDYLWILSREPHISDELYEDLITYVSSLGFDRSKIINVKQ